MRFNNRSRRGFTLVELLVVTIIIAILAATILPAVNWARRRAKITEVAMEVSQIEQAITAYKDKYTDHLPDFSNKAVVLRHIRKCYTQISNEDLRKAWIVFWVDPADDLNHASYVDPAEALVFWLSGMSEDPRQPFFGPGGPFISINANGSVSSRADVRINANRLKGPMDFQEGRLTLLYDNATGGRLSNDEEILHGVPADNDHFPVYLPSGLKQPYVYFDWRTYGGIVGPPTILPPQYPPVAYAASTRMQGTARPYLSDRRTTDPVTNMPVQEWVNKDTYQVISAGLDDNYGADNFQKQFPSGLNYSHPTGDLENIANFSDGKQLKDKKPD